MRSSPSVVFSTFTSSLDARYVSWARVVNRIRGLVADASDAAPSTAPGLRGSAREPANATALSPGRSGIWRLLARNNRELARSAGLFASADAAAAHVQTLQVALDRLELRLCHGEEHGDYLWVALLDCRPVLMSARAYEGAAAARSASVGALAALALADPTP